MYGGISSPRVVTAGGERLPVSVRVWPRRLVTQDSERSRLALGLKRKTNREPGIRVRGWSAILKLGTSSQFLCWLVIR